MRDIHPAIHALPSRFNRRVGELLSTASRAASLMARLSPAVVAPFVQRLGEAGARIQGNADRGVGFLEEAPPDTASLSKVFVGAQPFEASHLSLKVPDLGCEVKLRLQTSDIRTFEQIFVLKEYAGSALPADARTIVDLGANIGLASLYFGARYPEARILAIEPDVDNYAVMATNTAVLGPRFLRRNLAAWKYDGYINLHTQDEGGQPLGAWGFRVAGGDGSPSSKRIQCARMRTLLDQAAFESIDLLKIDVEGAELELFSTGADEWLPRVRHIIVETHDSFRPGSEQAVRTALGADFDELPRSGENLVFRRRERLRVSAPSSPARRFSAAAVVATAGEQNAGQQLSFRASPSAG